MTKEELIKAVRALQEDGIRLTAMEIELKIPKNNLSGMLNGERNFPEKYQRKLRDYVMARKNNVVLAFLFGTSSSETLSTPPPIPERSIAPAGLSKAETLKWHRQHNQTLQ